MSRGFGCFKYALPLLALVLTRENGEGKLEAVKLAQSSHKSQAQIARDLGIAESTLHKWCQRWSRAW